MFLLCMDSIYYLLNNFLLGMKLSFFLKKIESLSATVLAMKEALETLSGLKNENILEAANFL